MQLILSLTELNGGQIIVSEQSIRWNNYYLGFVKQNFQNAAGGQVLEAVNQKKH